MMGKKLKILHLEDLRSDAELVFRQLKDSDLSFTIAVVDNEQDFSSQLVTFLPDIILSDHSLPQFNSFGALEVLHRLNINIPFILITSSTSEEIAVSVMKAGAWDYILKDRMQRLPMAIQQAMEKFSTLQEKEKTENTLQYERSLLRSLIDHMPDFVYVKDVQSKHILNNRANWELLGATSEAETLGKSLVDYFGEGAMGYITDDVEVMKSGMPTVNKEETIMTVMGEPRTLLTTKVPLHDAQGEVTGIAGISRDITELKKQEQTIHQFQQNLDIIFSNTREEILLLDLEGKVVLFNNAFEKFLVKVTGRKPEVGGYVLDMTLQSRKGIARSSFDKALLGEAIDLEDSMILPEGFVARELHYEPIYVDGAIKFVSVILNDITKRKKAELELLKSRQLLLEANEIAKIGTWIFNPQTNENELNEQAMVIFKKPAHYKENFDEYLKHVHPDDQVTVRNAITNTLESARSYDIEHRIIDPEDGEIRWIHERADFITSDNNQQLLIGVVQDITERKAAEQSLIEFNERYEILSRATNDAIWDLNMENDVEVWNHGIESIFGYTNHTIDYASEWWKKKIHPSDYERIQREIKAAIDGKRNNWSSSYQYQCADGGYKYVLDRAYIIYENDQPVRMIGAIQDVTEQKNFENQITAIAREFSGLIENANTPIFGTDRNLYINEWNKVMSAQAGYSRNEVLGKPLINFIRADQHEYLRLILNRVSRGEPVSDLQMPIIAKGKKDIIILTNATPRINASQELTGILLVGQNITELIEYRENLEMKVRERTHELNEALNKEKEVVEMKGRFVSIASHEFRTPLSTISIVSGFLRKHREKLTADEFEIKLKSIEKQVNHMTYLLDDILMIGKTEAGKILVQRKAIIIDDFFRQAAREVQENTKTHDVLVENTTSIKEFSGDEKLLRNITINLLTNGIKFSPKEKSIILRLSNSSDYLKIEVEDHGIGMSEEDQSKIFTAFHRGSNVGNIEGTGLGLSIVKKAVDLLSGNIEFFSSVGKGTRINITLPIR